MALPIAGILAWFGSFFTAAIAKIIVDRVLFFIAIKALLVFLCTVIFPIVMNNFLYDLLEIGSNIVQANADTPSGLDGVMQFTGLMAWCLDVFNIPECISICLGALIFRLSIINIPIFAPRLDG